MQLKREKTILLFHREMDRRQSLRETANLDLLLGQATFTGFKKLSVKLNNGNTQELTAEKIFIDTGGKPQVPNIEGINNVVYLTSTTILDLEEVPENLLIIGAGYIALEFGQLFQRLGSRVTILESSPTFLNKEDNDVADVMLKILQEDGITILLNAITKKLQNTANQEIEASIEVNGKIQEIISSHVLIATGRLPQTKELALDKTGVTTDEKGHILVNDKLETIVAGIYALGDVKGGPEFTHISYNDFVMVFQNLIHNAGHSIKDRLVPYCMFTDP